MGIRQRRQRPDPLDAVWPDSVEVASNLAKLGPWWIRSYTVAGYPRTVEPGWFEPLLAVPFPLTLALSTGPVANQEAMRTINRRLIWGLGAQQAANRGGRLASAEEGTAIEDAHQIRVGVARGETRLLEVGMTLTIWAESQDLLEERSRLLESLTQGMLLIIRPLRFQQQLGLRRLLPLASPTDKVREMDSQAWATVFPFSSRELVHASGQVMGINPDTHSLIVVDRFRLASPHSVTVGWSGSGKSFLSKLEALRTRYRGWAVTIIDPEGEYRILEAVGATRWALGQAPTPRFVFDPFTIDGSLEPEERERQADFLLRLLTRLNPDLMTEFGPLVRDVVWLQVSETRTRFFPLQGKVLTADRLIQLLTDENRRAGDRLALSWERWNRLLGAPGGSPPDDFEIFDLSGLTEHMKAAAYLALTEWVMRRVGRDVRRLVIFDEAWHLFNDVGVVTYLEELFRRARKWGTAISLVTQDIGDLTRSHAAEVCLRNAPLVNLMRQHPDSLTDLSEVMRLHEGELERLKGAMTGEGLLLAEDAHVPFKVIFSPAEQRVLQAEWRR